MGRNLSSFHDDTHCLLKTHSHLPSLGLSLLTREMGFVPKAFVAFTFHGFKYFDNRCLSATITTFQPRERGGGQHIFPGPFHKHNFVSWANYK